MPLVPQITLHAFDKWSMDFVGPISPTGKCIGACYIITVIYYLTRSAKEVLIKDCNAVNVAKFLFESVVT